MSMSSGCSFQRLDTPMDVLLSSNSVEVSAPPSRLRLPLRLTVRKTTTTRHGMRLPNGSIAPALRMRPSSHPPNLLHCLPASSGDPLANSHALLPPPPPFPRFHLCLRPPYRVHLHSPARQPLPPLSNYHPLPFQWMSTALASPEVPQSSPVTGAEALPTRSGTALPSSTSASSQWNKEKSSTMTWHCWRTKKRLQHVEMSWRRIL